MASIDGSANDSTLAERYRVLLEIGRSLAGTLSEDDLYRAIYRETARVLQADGFYIAVYDPARDRARVVFYADRGQEKEESIEYRGSDSEVIRTGSPSMVEDRLELHSLIVLGEEDTEITRSAISAPMRYKGRVVGAVSAQSYRPRAYSQADVELLQGIGDVAAVAVENARHVAEIQRRRREAERLEEIGRALSRSLDAQEVLEKVIQAATHLLEADSATVWLLEREESPPGWVARVGACTRVLDLPGGSIRVPPALVERVVRRREAITVDDLHQAEAIPDILKERLGSGTRSGLLVPLVTGDRVVGALSAGSAEHRLFTREDEQLLWRLASQAAVSLENARLHQKLQALSLTDPLTGLPNRRHLEIELERESAAAGRGRSLCVVLFDLDNFKQYNDRLGHMAGDEVLRCLGAILHTESRAMNLVARFGGDEFVSLLSDTDEEGARNHAERVAAAVARHPFMEPHGITISYGIARHGAEGDTGEELLRKADEALYRSKANRPGRSGSRSMTPGTR